VVSIDKSTLKWIEARGIFHEPYRKIYGSGIFRDLYMREKTVPVEEEIYWAADTPETKKTTVSA
jgi:hypothetical protein